MEEFKDACLGLDVRSIHNYLIHFLKILNTSLTAGCRMTSS